MKRKLLYEILDFCKKQREALMEENINRFDRLTRRKTELVEQIIRIEKEFPQEKNEKYIGLLEEIRRLDVENINRLENQMKEVKDELRTVRELKRRNDGYTNPYIDIVSSGQYFDQK